MEKQFPEMPVPTPGFGTWQLTGDTCVRAVRDALEVGYRHIDTAQMYGNEAEVGEAIAVSDLDRSEVFLTTKLANDAHTPAAVRRSTEDSLRRLRIDYLDLLLIHWPIERVPIAETVEAMAGLVAEDKVRHLGVSNFTVAQVREAQAVAPIKANQVEYHPFLSQADLVELAEEEQMMLGAYSPLARGRVLSDPTLRDIAGAHGVSPAAIALRWLIDQGPVVPVPKASTREHMEANWAALRVELDDEERAAIDGLGKDTRLIDPPWSPDWD